jgi:hypothetical protein
MRADLKTNADKTYHLGIGNIVAKSTLAVANEIVLTLFSMIGRLLIRQAMQYLV